LVNDLKKLPFKIFSFFFFSLYRSILMNIQQNYIIGVEEKKEWLI